MGKFIYLANIIAADVDFYNIEGNRGCLLYTSDAADEL